MGDCTDVITIGDSFMNSNGFEGTEISLEKVSGRDYRNYGVAGTQLLDGRIRASFELGGAAKPEHQDRGHHAPAATTSCSCMISCTFR